MAELDIRVLAADTSQDLTFAKITDFEAISSVNTTDFLLVSGFRDGEQITQRIKIADIAEYFNQELALKEAKWFIPIADNVNSIIHWELHTIAETGTQEGDPMASNPIMPINILDLIGDVTDTKSGLLPPAYKAKLDALDGATESHDGLMSAADKTKLNGIETGANNYVLPTASTSTLGGVKIDGSSITIDNNGVIRANSGAPDAVRISIGISDWDIQTHTAKVNTPIDTSKLNTINVDANSLDEWINCRVHAISEDSTGITFACQSVPTATLSALILSTVVSIT